MSLKENLEIFLITYNREKALNHTLQYLLDKESPVQDITINVLDNKSTDKTKSIVKKFVEKHSNLHYVCNKYNVGLGGNLVKAMEMASKPYFWILCDDDNFNWNAWQEIEKAILSGKYDIVMTTHTEGFRSEKIPYLINEMCFVPSAIYKTSHIDNTVMTNAYAMVHNLFPFHALSIKIINNNGKIFVPQGRVVLQDYGPKSHQNPKLRPGIYRRLQTFSLFWGYIDSYSLIEDKKLRYQCMDVLCLGKSFYKSIRNFISGEYPWFFPFTWQNLFDIFYYCSLKQKFIVIMAVLVQPFFRLRKKCAKLLKSIKTKIIKREMKHLNH